MVRYVNFLLASTVHLRIEMHACMPLNLNCSDILGAVVPGGSPKQAQAEQRRVQPALLRCHRPHQHLPQPLPRSTGDLITLIASVN